jgi:dipeptidase E
MKLLLLSYPGEPFLTDILFAAREMLVGVEVPQVAYLPATAQDRHFVRETKHAFRGLAEVRAIKPEIHSTTAMQRVLDRASLLYIPGGNTYLAAQRLHAAGWMDELRQRIQDGLPLVAFSAGTVLCGVDILTTNDANECACATFNGLGLLPYNLNVHYPPTDGEERLARDARLHAYAVSHPHSVLALEDGAVVRVTSDRVEIVRGIVWKFENQKKERVL